jgi:predicted RNase H-like HicB family nuclease
MKIKAIIWQEDGVWCASVPALPGCHTWGDSYEHLLEMLQDAIQGWLEVAKEGVDAILSIPVHSNQDLPKGTLKSIMKDAELTEEDLG